MNFQTVLGLLRPNVASLGYGLFLAINAASVWGGVFPFLPLGYGNDGKPYRVYHITTASAHPLFPLRLSPCPREKFKRFFEGPKGP